MGDAPGAACESDGRRRRTRTAVVIILICVAVVVAASLWPPSTVETVVPVRRDIVELIVASGRLRTPRRSGVGSEVGGIASAVFVDVGARVESGQELVQIRSEDAQHRLELGRRVAGTARAELNRVKAGPPPQELGRAAADLEAARAVQRRDEAAYTRTRRLAETSTASNEQLDNAKSAFDQATARVASTRSALEALRAMPRPEDIALAEARLAETEASVLIAEVQLAKHTIRAPFAGVVVARDIEPGAGVAPRTPLVTLADVDRAEVYVETDENNLARLRVGQEASVAAAAYPNRTFDATLAQIDPLVDSQRGIVALRLKPETLPDFALVDMTVDVNIVVARREGALAVPLSALVSENGVWRAFVVREERVSAVDVEYLGTDGSFAAVSGLDENAVVVREATKVRPGARVRPAGGE